MLGKIQHEIFYQPARYIKNGCKYFNFIVFNDIEKVIDVCHGIDFVLKDELNWQFTS